MPTTISMNARAYATLSQAGIPNPAETLNLKRVKARHTFYADPDADGATADGTPDKPFATLQDAVDAVESGARRICFFLVAR